MVDVNFVYILFLLLSPFLEAEWSIYLIAVVCILENWWLCLEISCNECHLKCRQMKEKDHCHGTDILMFLIWYKKETRRSERVILKRWGLSLRCGLFSFECFPVQFDKTASVLWFFSFGNLKRIGSKGVGDFSILGRFSCLIAFLV